MAIMELQPHLESFGRLGYAVIPNALSPAQAVQYNNAIDRYLQRFPLSTDEWTKSGSASYQALDVLPNTSDFDAVIEHPTILAFARAWFGDEVTFEHLSILIRDPEPNPSEPKGWHRDNTRNYERRHEIGSLSVIYYLTDVSPVDHCFSIVPETHKRRADLRPEDVAPGEEVDIIGPAGTAIAFHARCIHSGKVKSTSRQRRTLHLYYWEAGQPRTSDTSTIPARLHLKANPDLPPKLYAKWDVRELLDEIGRAKRK